MTPNPFLNQVRARLAYQGVWSKLARFPQVVQRTQPTQRVFLLKREERQFVIVAKDFVEADNRLSTLLA